MGTGCLLEPLLLYALRAARYLPVDLWDGVVPALDDAGLRRSKRAAAADPGSSHRDCDGWTIQFKRDSLRAQCASALRLRADGGSRAERGGDDNRYPALRHSGCRVR